MRFQWKCTLGRGKLKLGAVSHFSALMSEGNKMNSLFRIAASASLALGLATAASAATVTIQDVSGSPVYGALSYTGADSDIQGYYGGAWNDLLAERYAAGNNAYESNLVAGITGISGLDLGGTALAIVGSSTTIAAYTYFTAKFAQSLAVFYNGTANAIQVSFSSSECTATTNNVCGEISHYKHVTVEPGVVPLPAGGVLMLTALGGLAFARRRKA